MSEKIIPIPSTHESAGILMEGDQIVSWGTSPERVFWWTGGEQVRFAAHNDLVGPIGAHISLDRKLTILDSAAKAELTFDGTGRLLGKAPLAIPDGAEMAVKYSNVWYASTIDRDSAARIVVIENTEHRTVIRQRVSPDSGGPLRERLFLVGSKNGPIAVSRFFPFNFYVGDPQSAGFRRIDADFSQASGAPSVVSMRSLVAVGFVPLDQGFLLTLADLTTVKRLLATVDLNGRVMRVREFALPMAFAAGDQRAKAIVALRRFSAHQELQLYKWAWAPADTGDTISP